VSKSVREYFDIFETRNHPRRFWNKDKTRHYKCRKCSWETTTPTKSYGAMSGFLTSQRVGLELGVHSFSHEKKKAKNKKKDKK